MTQSNSDNLNAQLRDARKLHQAGQLGIAAKRYRRILSADPHHANANNLMGLLCIQTGQVMRAIEFIRAALEKQPDNPQSHYNLGIAFKDLGDLNSAADSFHKSVSLSPGNLEAINSLANVLRLAGKPKEALPLFQKILASEASHAAALCNLGYTFTQLDRFEEAEASFKQALSSQPNMPEALNGMGELLIAKDMPAAALESLRKAIQIDGNHAQAHNNLGVATNKLGDVDQAIASFRQAAKLKSGFAEAHLNLGLTLEQTGSLEEAAASYKAAIEARKDFVMAHFHLAHLRTHPSSREEISAMQDLYRNENLADGQKVRLAFGIGCASEKIADYPAAFEFFSRAHQLRAKKHPFNLNKAQDLFHDIESVFRPELVESLCESGVRDERPVFVLGLPRSGTSLVEQVLASHPDVHGCGESVAIAQIAGECAAVLGTHYPGFLTKIESGSLAAHAQKYLDGLVAETGSAQRFTDTTPMNFLYLGLVAIMFPRARFIHCYRDAMDQCMSIYRQMLTEPHAYANDLRDLGGYYLLYRQLMIHWYKIFPGRIHKLKYERLVQDQEHETRKLLDFCGLGFDERCLAFHESKRTVRSPSAGQVHQPLYSSSIGAWKHYENELEPLRQTLGYEEPKSKHEDIAPEGEH